MSMIAFDEVTFGDSILSRKDAAPHESSFKSHKSIQYPTHIFLVSSLAIERTLEKRRCTMNYDKVKENIQIWKIRRLIKSLDSAKGCAIWLFRHYSTSQ